MRTLQFLTFAAIAAGLVGCASSAAPSRGMHVSDRSCAGVTGADQALSAVYERGAVTTAAPVYQDPAPMRGRSSTALAGAELHVPAPAGVTSAHLERALSCHAAGQLRVAERPGDPLRVPGIEDVDVSQAGSNLSIVIRAKDRDAAQAVWQRARAMQAGGSVKVQQLASRDKAGQL